MSAPIYLYTGPEFGERNDQVDTIKKELKKKFGETDDYLLYASDSGIEEIITKLQTESLFVPATIVVLREAELIKKKEEIELLSRWLESAKKNNRESASLILVSDEISVDSKLDKLVPKENKKIFWEMFENKKPEWVQNFFRKNGFSIMPDAVESILDMIENNTEALRTECSRFFYCFQKDHVITAQDVEQILSHNREESVFTLFDAMSDSSVPRQKRFEISLSILQKILMAKNNVAIMFIAGLASCFRRLELWHTINPSGSAADEATLRSNGFVGKTIRKQYEKAARTWTFGQTAAIVAEIASVDMELRSCGTAMQESYLFMLIYEIVMKNGAKASKYEIDSDL